MEFIFDINVHVHKYHFDDTVRVFHINNIIVYFYISCLEYWINEISLYGKHVNLRWAGGLRDFAPSRIKLFICNLCVCLCILPPTVPPTRSIYTVNVIATGVRNPAPLLVCARIIAAEAFPVAKKPGNAPGWEFSFAARTTPLFSHFPRQPTPNEVF